MSPTPDAILNWDKYTTIQTLSVISSVQPNISTIKDHIPKNKPSTYVIPISRKVLVPPVTEGGLLGDEGEGGGRGQVHTGCSSIKSRFTIRRHTVD